MNNGNLSPVYVYPREIHGVCCEFLDEVNLTRVSGLSRSWKIFIQGEIDHVWRNLHEKIWFEPLVTTTFVPTAFKAFCVRYRCVKLDLTYKNSWNTVPHVVRHTEKIRGSTSQDYFNALLIEKYRETVLSTFMLPQFVQQTFISNLRALPLADDEKRRWQAAFTAYDQYANISLQIKTAMDLFQNNIERAASICQSSLYREFARYIVKEICLLGDPQQLINPDANVVDACLSHTTRVNYLTSEVHLIMWKAISPDLFEMRSKELLFEAANRGSLEIIGALLQEIDCSVKTPEGEDDKNWTALHYLSLRSDKDITPKRAALWKEIANKLIQIGCSPIQRGDNQDSPMTLAMRAGNMYLMECFLNHLQTQEALVLSKGWEQLVEVIEEDENDLLSDSQIQMIGMAFTHGFCANITENKDFIYKLLVRSEWDLLPLFVKYSSPAQMEEMLSLVFEWARKDCLCEGDQDYQSDTYSIVLPELESFLEAARLHNLDFKKVDSEGNSCLPRCIKFFEDEIQSVYDNLDEEEYEEDEGEDILEMLQDSYLRCVKILLTDQTILQAHRHSGHDLLDLVNDRESDVYAYLFESMNPAKKRALKD